MLGPLWKQEAAHRCTGAVVRLGSTQLQFVPPRNQSRVPLACHSHEGGTCLVCIQTPTALASVSTRLPGLSMKKNTGKQKPPDRRPSLQRRGGGRQEAGGGRLRRREVSLPATAPEHKNNEARGAVGPSRLVPESLSDLDRCHSWAPGEELQPQRCKIPLPPSASPRPGRWRFRQAPATGSHPTRWERGDLNGSQLGVRVGMWEGVETGEWGQGHCRAGNEVSRGCPGPQAWLYISETRRVW